VVVTFARYSNIWTSGLGCALCVIVMFMIDTKNNCILALATCVIGFLLYKCSLFVSLFLCLNGFHQVPLPWLMRLVPDVEYKKPNVNWGAASAARR